MNINIKCSLQDLQFSPVSYYVKAVNSNQLMLTFIEDSTVEHLRNCAASASVETFAHYIWSVDTDIQLIMTARIFFWIHFCSPSHNFCTAFLCTSVIVTAIIFYTKFYWTIIPCINCLFSLVEKAAMFA